MPGNALSAKHGLAIACRPSVCLWSGSHRLEIFKKTNCTDNYPNTFALRVPKATHLLPEERGEILRRLENQMWWGRRCWARVLDASPTLWRDMRGTHMYRAHRAVIFTIAQLSYFQNGNDHISKHAVLFSYSKPVAFKTAVTLAAPVIELWHRSLIMLV